MAFDLGVATLGAGALSGALSYLGGTEANSANALQAEYNRGFNAQEAQKNREFQERMRATQYQTTVADLKSAGLNPMLAYVQGGAGNVAGSAATGSMPAPMENVLGKVGNSAREGAMAVQQYENLKTQNFATEQQGEQAASQALLNKDQAAKTRMETISELLKQPGFNLSGEEKQALINSLNAAAKQATNQSALSAAQTNQTNVLTDLAKQGIAPSSSKAIYNDLKRLGVEGYNKFAPDSWGKIK